MSEMSRRERLEAISDGPPTLPKPNPAIEFVLKMAGEAIDEYAQQRRVNWFDHDTARSAALAALRESLEGPTDEEILAMLKADGVPTTPTVNAEVPQ